VREESKCTGAVLDMDEVKGGREDMWEVVRQMGGGGEGDLGFLELMEVSGNPGVRGDGGKGGGKEGVGVEREEEEGVGG